MCAGSSLVCSSLCSSERYTLVWEPSPALKKQLSSFLCYLCFLFFRKYAEGFFLPCYFLKYFPVFFFRKKFSSYEISFGIQCKEDIQILSKMVNKLSKHILLKILSNLVFTFIISSYVVRMNFRAFYFTLIICHLLCYSQIVSSSVSF